MVPPVYFVKLDLANCFFLAIQLPHEINGAFTISSPITVLQTRSLPFGWAWSPILATCFVRDILRPVVCLLNGLMWQFIDDVLMAHADPHYLRFCALHGIFLLERHGFLINAKSVTVLIGWGSYFRPCRRPLPIASNVWRICLSRCFNSSLRRSTSPVFAKFRVCCSGFRARLRNRPPFFGQQLQAVATPHASATLPGLYVVLSAAGHPSLSAACDSRSIAASFDLRARFLLTPPNTTPSWYGPHCPLHDQRNCAILDCQPADR